MELYTHILPMHFNNAFFYSVKVVTSVLPISKESIDMGNSRRTTTGVTVWPSLQIELGTPAISAMASESSSKFQFQ